MDKLFHFLLQMINHMYFQNILDPNHINLYMKRYDASIKAYNLYETRLIWICIIHVSPI